MGTVSFWDNAIAKKTTADYTLQRIGPKQGKGSGACTTDYEHKTKNKTCLASGRPVLLHDYLGQNCFCITIEMYFCSLQLRPYGTCQVESVSIQVLGLILRKALCFQKYRLIILLYNLKASGFPVRNCFLPLNEDRLYKPQTCFCICFSII